MDTKQFGEWLDRLVAEGRLTRLQADDQRNQRRLFDANRAAIESGHAHRVVGYCADRLFVAGSFLDLMSQIGQIPGIKGRQVYYEQL